MSSLDPYLFVVTDKDGGKVMYHFMDFLHHVLGYDMACNAHVSHNYFKDMFNIARKAVETARSIKGVDASLELDPNWEEVFIFEKSKPKCTYTFTSFEQLEKAIAESCGVKLYMSTAGEELSRQMVLFIKDHTNFGAMRGVRALTSVVHEHGPERNVYVSLADGSNPDQEDTCRVLYEDGMHEKMIQLEEVASRAGCSVRRNVRRKPVSKVEISIPKSDDNFLRSRSLNTQQVAQNAVDAAIRKLKGEK